MRLELCGSNLGRRRAVGTSADNAACESFHASHKREALQSAPDHGDAAICRRAVLRCLTRYNIRPRIAGALARAPAGRDLLLRSTRPCWTVAFCAHAPFRLEQEIHALLTVYQALVRAAAAASRQPSSPCQEFWMGSAGGLRMSSARELMPSLAKILRRW